MTHNTNNTKTTLFIMKKTLFFLALAAAMGFNSAEAVELTPTGDVRFRYESHQNKYDGANVDYSNDRWRTRVRFGVNAWINEELSAGVSISTGDKTNYESSVSRNQSYSTLFNGKSIWLNEAYIDYHPMNYGFDGQVNVILGKRDVAKTLVRVDDMLYDGDLTFEGATMQYGKAADGKEKDGLVFIAGYYFLDQVSTSYDTATKINDPAKENDPFMTVVQLAYKGEFNDMSYMLGVSDHNFRNIKHIGAVDAKAETKNVMVDDRNIVELFGTVGGDLTETLPWQLRGQYAHNTGENAVKNEKNAWLAGLSIGNAKQPGQWALDFNYNRIEKDSVFPFFTDSDRKVGSYNTGTQGWEVGATYHLVQNMTVGAKYYNYYQIHSLEAGNPRLHTLQADMVVKF
ncbi:MAG: hypothetical protein HGB02_05355 [Chlorobiaceae bacterium]|nr:hypothetical protein [Chlorobiaceae bacterium]